MKPKTFAKSLSANDVGATGSHQAGILVPKSDPQLLAFFPRLDHTELNPDALLIAKDDQGQEWKFRYVYYNNRLHSETGTRNEYRLTRLTAYFDSVNAKPGDVLVFASVGGLGQYRISLQRRAAATAGSLGLIKLTGWRRVH